MAELSKHAQDKVEQLRKDYISSLPNKITQIEASWSKVKQGANNKNLKELARLSHKFSGSAGAYGLISFAKALQDLEASCNQSISAGIEQDAALKQTKPYYDVMKNIVNSELYD